VKFTYYDNGLMKTYDTPDIKRTYHYVDLYVGADHRNEFLIRVMPGGKTYEENGFIAMLMIALSLFFTGCGDKYARNMGDSGHCAICGKGSCSEVPYNDYFYCIEHYAEAYRPFTTSQK